MRSVWAKRIGASAVWMAGLGACGGGGSGSSPGPGPAPVTTPAATAESVVWDRWTPYVIAQGSTEPVLYEVAVSGTVTSGVTLTSGDKTMVLHDDGANGDLAARDGIWSASIDPAIVFARNSPGRVHRPFVGPLRVNGGTDSYNVIAEVFGSALPVVPVYPVDEGGQETDYVVNYVATPAQLLQPDREYWARRFYAKHGDDYDFVQVVVIGGRRGNRSHSTVRNPVEGIGLQLFDRSADAGSKGRLLGITLYPMPAGFDGAEKTFAHELGHQWINYLPGTVFTRAQPHWPQGSIGANIMGANIAGSNVGGDHPYLYEPNAGGYLLKPAPPGQASVFNMMELYMMGLASAAEVPEYVVLKDQARRVDAGTQLAAADVQVIRVADVIAAAGPRKPDASSAQRHFRIATIVVSGRPLDAREMSFYDFFARRAEATTILHCAALLVDGPCYPWHLATGGRSTMTAKIRGPAGTYASTMR